jgi:hypothetical protein
MLDVEDFDAVFQGLSYTDGIVQQIQEYQLALGGRTFFERLLDVLKIKGMQFLTAGSNAHRLTTSRQENIPSEDTPAIARPPPAHRFLGDHSTQQALLDLLRAQGLIASAS